MLPVLEVSGQLHGGVRLLSGVLWKDWKRPVNFMGCVQLLPGVLLKDDCPSLNDACVGSVRSTSGGFAAVVRCFLES